MRRIVACLLWSVGCDLRSELSLPSIPGARTLIVTAQSESLRSVVVAEVGGDAQVVEYLNPGGDQLTVELTALEATLGQLDFAPGDQPQGLPWTKTYPLPIEGTRHRASFAGMSADDEWQPFVAPSALEETVGLKAASLSCLERGGCLSLGESPTCREPCLVEPPEPPSPPTPPDPPSPIVLTPCPSGWTEDPNPREVTRCRPWPLAEPEPCPEGQVHFPGEPACAPLLGACDPAAYAPDLPLGPRLYVDSAATGPADGSEGAPFSSLGDALAVAQDGAVIALARGSYQGGVTISRSVGIYGACGAEVSIVAPEGEPGLVLDAAVDLSRATIVGGSLVVTAEGRAFIRGVEVRDAPEIGILLEGGALSAFETSVTRSSSVGVALFGGSLVADRLSIQNVTRQALLATEASQLQLSRMVVRDVKLTAMGARGIGMMLLGATTATLTETVIERAYTVGLAIGQAGTRVTASDLWIKGIEAEVLRADYGDGLGVYQGASASIRRVQVAETERAAINVSEEGRATLEDVFVGPSIEFGTGIRAILGAEAIVRRASITGQVLGLRAASGGRMTASDIEIDELRPDSNGVVADDGELSIARASISDLIGTAVLSRVGANLNATDLEISGIDGATLDGTGIGVQCAVGAALRLERARIREVGSFAVVLAGASNELTDMDVETRRGTALWVAGDSSLRRFTGSSSYGAQVSNSAHLRAEDLTLRIVDRGACDASALKIDASSSVALVRGEIEEAFGVGIKIYGGLEAEQLMVRDVHPYLDECRVDSFLAPDGHGAAFEAREAAQVTLDHFAIESSPIGASLDRGVVLMLTNGVMKGVGVGMIIPERRIPSTGRMIRFDDVAEVARLRPLR